MAHALLSRYSRALFALVATTVTFSAVAPRTHAQGARARGVAPQTAQPDTQTASQPSSGMRFGAVVRPDTIQVGDPFTLTVTVEVPAGAHVTWPIPSDTSGPVAIRSPVHVSGNENGALRRETATYDMVAWNVGPLPITMPDIKVKDGDTESLIPFTASTIFVETVLPADTALRVPKPAKALFPRIVPWWQLWWPVFVVLAVLLLIAWIATRSKKRKFERVMLDPFARAERDFQRLDKLALSEAGEQGRFVALALEVMRTYFSVRIPAATLALTSEELMGAVAADSRVPTQLLAPLLADADAIKFGQYPVNAADARTFATSARDVVSAVEQAEVARQNLLRAQQRTEGKLNKELQRQTEDRARQESRRGKSEAA